jgi:hypothetical protein
VAEETQAAVPHWPNSIPDSVARRVHLDGLRTYNSLVPLSSVFPWGGSAVLSFPPFSSPSCDYQNHTNPSHRLRMECRGRFLVVGFDIGFDVGSGGWK